jgi:predicted DsbA family dithiol-disulfide isomerase
MRVLPRSLSGWKHPASAVVAVIVQVEIWSDVVCPWCYIGKRRFETALASFPHRDEVEVLWRSFELDPRAPRTVDGDPIRRLAGKYGVSVEQAAAMHGRVTSVAAEEGLSYRLDIARRGNTFDAHRLLHLAADEGRQGELQERLLAAYQSEGEAIGDPDTLARLAVEVDLDEAEVRDVLASDRYGDGVRADERDAMELGVSGVPFFLVDRRYAVPGAQSPDLLRRALDRAWADQSPVVVLGEAGDDGACGPDACDLPQA